MCSRIHTDTVHALEINDKVTILTTQAEGGVRMPTTLGAHFQAVFDTTEYGGLDLLDSGGLDICSGFVSQTLVEGHDVDIPGAVSSSFVGYAGPHEAGSDSVLREYGRVGIGKSQERG